MRKHYVVGLAFNRVADKLALICKKRPQWQAGKLNGIGGQVEVGETAETAMQREFQEETGVQITSPWVLIATLDDDLAHVDIFCSFDDRVLHAVSTTDEAIEILAPTDPSLSTRGVGDLPALVARALDPTAQDVLRLGTARLIPSPTKAKALGFESGQQPCL